MARRTERQARSVLRARLEARRPELEAAIVTRIRTIADPDEVSDPIYADGLRSSVAAAIGFGIETTGREGSDLPIPVALSAQARLAARAGIPLDTVLRRYFAGYTLLGNFILEEAGNAGIVDGAELKRLLGAHAGTFDRLLAGVSEEHVRESENLAPATGDRRRVERIERLLAGEQVDTSEIPYDLEGWHVAVVAAGPGAEKWVRELADGRDLRLLLVHRAEEGALWAWLGSGRRLDLAGPIAEAAPGTPTGALAFGEPARGLVGWRLTHRQASAALAVALRGPKNVVRYADVALLATALRDELLGSSLRELYLDRLERSGPDGETAKSTLRAYFRANRNVSSAAAALGVRWHTIASRLKTIEESIGRPIESCATELETALRLEES